LEFDLIATFQGVRVDVIKDGEQSGGTVIVPAGQPVQAAFRTDTAAFEQRFLDPLNGRR
jgi:hypothetical protein